MLSASTWAPVTQTKTNPRTHLSPQAVTHSVQKSLLSGRQGGGCSSLRLQGSPETWPGSKVNGLEGRLETNQVFSISLDNKKHIKYLVKWRYKWCVELWIEVGAIPFFSPTTLLGLPDKIKNPSTHRLTWITEAMKSVPWVDTMESGMPHLWTTFLTRTLAVALLLPLVQSRYPEGILSQWWVSRGREASTHTWDVLALLSKEAS